MHHSFDEKGMHESRLFFCFEHGLVSRIMVFYF